MMDIHALMAAMEATAVAAEKPIAVEVKEWGTTVYVRPLQASDLDEQIAEDAKAAKEDKSAFARGVMRLMCDENGARNWDTGDPKKVALMKRQPWRLLSKIADAVNPDEGEVPNA